jgi:hypothetical protein
MGMLCVPKWMGKAADPAKGVTCEDYEIGGSRGRRMSMWGLRGHI